MRELSVEQFFNKMLCYSELSSVLDTNAVNQETHNLELQGQSNISKGLTDLIHTGAFLLIHTGMQYPFKSSKIRFNIPHPPSLVNEMVG